MNWTGNIRRPALFLIAALLICAAGCLPKAKPATVTTPAGQELNARELRVRLYELTTQLGGILETAADRIAEETEDRQVRRNALVFKATAIPTLQRSAFHSDSFLSAAEVWLLSVQLRHWISDGEGREQFGDQQWIAVEAAERMQRQVEAFVESAGGNTDGEAGRQIEKFARQHPIEGAIGARGTAITPLVRYMRKGKMSAFASVGSMVDSIDDLSDRLAIYGELLPKQARWQAEILLQEQGFDQIEVDAVLADLERIGNSAEQLQTFLDEIPVMIDERIEATIPTLETAIATFDFDPLKVQADELISKHLETALEAVTRERVAAMEAIGQEREIVMADVTRLLDDVMDRSFGRVETQIEAQLTRMIPLGIAVMAGPFVLGLVAGLLIRRRSTS